jgi:serine/threonine-protein kinase
VIRQRPSAQAFAVPEAPVDLWVSLGQAQVSVPSVVGLDKSDAQRQLEGDPYHFSVTLKEENSDEPAGRVLRTSPPANSQVDPGSGVTIFYSDGPEQVPDVVGLKEGAAKARIKAAGFQPRVLPDPESTKPAGTVTDQSPNPGQTAQQGATVTLLVSAPQQPSESPTPSESPSASESPSPSPSATPTLGQRGNGNGNGHGNGNAGDLVLPLGAVAPLALVRRRPGSRRRGR